MSLYCLLKALRWYLLLLLVLTNSIWSSHSLECSSLHNCLLISEVLVTLTSSERSALITLSSEVVCQVLAIL